MYTTNIIESVNSKFRKATSGKRVFPTGEALLKCLYMAALDLEKKMDSADERLAIGL